MTQKQAIAVLFGGMSSEYEISLLSAGSVIKQIPKDRYETICIGITKQGRWLRYIGPIEKIENDTWHEDANCVRAMISADRSEKGILQFEKDGSLSLLKVDCILPVLHGKNGEDGTMQGLLSLSGIPYVGCDTLSSAVCMDKSVTHVILENAGIRCAKWKLILKEDAKTLSEKLEKIVQELSFPLFIKPANSGSSVGISRAEDMHALKEGIALAFAHDNKVVVEEEIQGAEVECAVLERGKPYASVLGQIKPCNSFYDYQAKYQGDSELIIPALLDEQTTAAVQQNAVNAFCVLGCRGLARVDFFVTKDNQVVLNEVNTLPGFTAISMYPKLWQQSGLAYADLIDTLIQQAIKH